MIDGRSKSLSRAERHEAIVRYVAARNGSTFATDHEHRTDRRSVTFGR